MQIAPFWHHIVFSLSPAFLEIFS